VIPKFKGSAGYTDVNTYRIPIGTGGLRGGQTAPWFYRKLRSGSGQGNPLNIVITITNKTDAANPEQQIRGDL